jgi:hypothetical protein
VGQRDRADASGCSWHPAGGDLRGDLPSPPGDRHRGAPDHGATHREAEKIGPATIALFEAIMKAKPHPEQGFRSCLGILSLVRSYGPVSRITHFEGRVIALFHGLPAGISGAL